MTSEKEKDNFILYHTYKDHFDLLSDEDAGRLIKAIFMYNAGEEINLNPICKMAFSFIRSDLERNQKKWKDTKEKKIYGARKGNLKKWHPELFKKVEKKDIDLEEAEKIAYQPEKSYSDKKYRTTKSVKLTNKKEELLIIPDYINADLWNSFVVHRKEIKKKLTAQTMIALINKLSKMESEEEGSANKAISNSLENGYTGIFLPTKSSYHQKQPKFGVQ